MWVVPPKISVTASIYLVTGLVAFTDGKAGAYDAAQRRKRQDGPSASGSRNPIGSSGVP